MALRSVVPVLVTAALSICSVVLLQGCGSDSDSEDETKADTRPKVQIITEAGKAVIDVDATVTLVGTEGQFTFNEGPVWVPDENMWIFSDVPADTMYKYPAGGSVSVFRKPSHKANGNALDAEGRLITCEHATRAISRTNLTSQERTVLVDTFGGKLLNSPNDAVVSKTGLIYFTDPDYGGSESFGHGNEIVQEKNNVFRFNPATNDITSVVENYLRPNGLAFNKAQTKMYVSDSGASFGGSMNYSNPHDVGIFDVDASGSLSGGVIFATVPEGQGVPDGLRVDNADNVWSVSDEGVQVYNSGGTMIAKIKTSTGVTNLAFGGPDGKDLMMTASTSVWIIKTKVTDAQAQSGGSLFQV